MKDETDKDSIIRLFHVCKRYGTRNAIVDLSLDIFRNELLFISGPSGAGKTTLLKLMYLAESATEGQILIDGINLSRIPRNRIPYLRRKFGIVFQDYKLIRTKSVYENVALSLEVTGSKQKHIQKKVKSVLRTVGMENRLNSFPPGLSGGEQQRVAVARAVVGEPAIIVADEPTGNLDIEAADIILNLLKKFHSQGATVIIATHDMELINRTGGRVIYLKDGRLVKDAHHPLME
ncbi:MAG: cell division ATP-binding protein FtsE [Deltaproteobacteria bacterium]|nr:cell division ATP-binding protein FtsE [Deltaproteobacteria bacterium]MBW1993865.1 cell division ATP-binding protein FtsE [Deltaproteobacteria bacterium]MBW2150147.1 cell division ATP-binding protein FtsE [Deltaproteobacteria bacterium]